MYAVRLRRKWRFWVEYYFVDGFFIEGPQKYDPVSKQLVPEKKELVLLFNDRDCMVIPFEKIAWYKIEDVDDGTIYLQNA